MCVPSRRESFGPRVLEGWAARKPVVVTYKMDVQDLVHHGVDGMVVMIIPRALVGELTRYSEILERPNKWVSAAA